MAERRQDLLSRLADRGEEAFKKLPEMPGATRLLDATTNLRERVDELQRRMRGLEELTKRVDALERRLDQGAGTGSTSRKSTPRTTGAAARGTAEQTHRRATRPKSSTPKRPRGGPGSGSGSGSTGS